MESSCFLIKVVTHEAILFIYNTNNYIFIGHIFSINHGLVR